MEIESCLYFFVVLSIIWSLAFLSVSGEYFIFSLVLLLILPSWGTGSYPLWVLSITQKPSSRGGRE